MNVSPSPSPRRQPHQMLGNNDQGDFYQISLTNDASSRSSFLGNAVGPTQQRQRRPQSSFLGEGRYDGYNSSYNSYNSHDNSNGHEGTDSLRPVQQYHNAFSSADTDLKTDAASSLAPVPPASASPFASFSSASRAFLEHRRQQSIPNMLPSLASSISRSFSRAISPDRSTRPPRAPIPDYNDYSSHRNGKDTTDDSSETSDSEASDSEDSEDSVDIEDNEDRRRRSIAPFTGDRRYRQNNPYTTQPIGSRDTNPESPSPKANFASWLANSNTKGAHAARVGSPTRRFFAPSPTTPEKTSFTTRGGETPGDHTSGTARRRLSYASDGLSTPRSAGLAPASTATSRFAQLTTSMTATLSRLTQQQNQQQSRVDHRGRIYDHEDDEFYHLDVEASLFPSGQPADHDAFSPSAYKNLEANAVRTINRLHEAYQQRTTALWDLAAEKSARDEEFEEAETRVQHLKMQLEGMAHRAAEQQKDMEALKDELAAEKMARAHERAMLVASAGIGYQHIRDDDQMTTTVFSEDLGVEEAQRAALQKKRRDSRRHKSLRSAEGSSIDNSDDGDEEEEGDEDESASSVFSRSRSPTATASTNLDAHTAYHRRVAALGSISTKQGSRPASPSTATPVFPQQQALGKFQKLVKNVTAALKDEDGLGEYGAGDCRNCRGQDASFAWNTVGVLRDENKQLKLRVGQLEVAVEGALDMVNGVGLY